MTDQNLGGWGLSVPTDDHYAPEPMRFRLARSPDGAVVLQHMVPRNTLVDGRLVVDGEWVTLPTVDLPAEPKKLLTLAEHDAARMQQSTFGRDARQPQPNGIACPQCGAELFDSRPNEILTSGIGRKQIACYAQGCGYTWTRIA